MVSNFRGGRREINVRTGVRDRAFMSAAPPAVPPLEISPWSPTESLREHTSSRIVALSP